MNATPEAPPDEDDVTAEAIVARLPVRPGCCQMCGMTPDRACYLPPTRCPRPAQPKVEEAAR